MWRSNSSRWVASSYIKINPQEDFKINPHKGWSTSINAASAWRRTPSLTALSSTTATRSHAWRSRLATSRRNHVMRQVNGLKLSPRSTRGAQALEYDSESMQFAEFYGHANLDVCRTWSGLPLVFSLLFCFTFPCSWLIIWLKNSHARLFLLSVPASYDNMCFCYYVHS
jgi:hypothetical protein